MDRKHKNTNQTQQYGFTLIELIITMAIAAILVTVAVPNFSAIIQNNRITAEANEFITGIQLARSTAVKQQRNAQICASTTYNITPPTCTGGTNWAAGWVVWVDQNSDGTLDAAEVVRVSAPLSGNSTLTSAAQGAFQYSATGLVNNSDTLTLCDGRTAETGRSITISPAGRVSIADVACS